MINIIKINFKSVCLGFVSGALIMGTIPAAVKTVEDYIKVSYRDIRICVDGADVNTSGSEPFIYNGTTYLPVRAVSETLGKPVNWDGNSSTVYIGNYSNSQGNSSFNLEPYESDCFESYSDGESFMVSGVKRSNGFIMQGTGNRPYAIFNLDGQYTGFTFNLGHVDGSYMSDSTVKIYLDGNMVEEIEIGAEDMPQKITVPLNGALQMKITMGGYSWKGTSEYGFFDVKLY